MIGITGYMSGGKSYYAVEHMLGMMLKAHRVCSNIELCCRATTEYLGISCIFWKQLYYFLTDSPSGYHHIKITDYKNYPHGSPRGSSSYERDMCYIYLDEASSIFDSMTHASDKGVQAVAAWCRHTEKRGQRIFLIMQFASELHKRLRVHITEYIACTSTNTLKIPLLGSGVPWFLRNMTIRSRYLSDGETQIAPAKWYRLNPSVYNCYHTAQIVVGDNDVTPYVPISINYEKVKERKAVFFFAIVFASFVFVNLVLFLIWGFAYA